MLPKLIFIILKLNYLLIINKLFYYLLVLGKVLAPLRSSYKSPCPG